RAWGKLFKNSAYLEAILRQAGNGPLLIGYGLQDLYNGNFNVPIYLVFVPQCSGIGLDAVSRKLKHFRAYLQDHEYNKEDDEVSFHGTRITLNIRK
ncbi:hypothetical protein F5883DRAFT_398553, partial [Diaporthe sp. PMI_573]